MHCRADGIVTRVDLGLAEEIDTALAAWLAKLSVAPKGDALPVAEAQSVRALVFDRIEDCLAQHA